MIFVGLCTKSCNAKSCAYAMPPFREEMEECSNKIQVLDLSWNVCRNWTAAHLNPGSCKLVIHKWSWTRHIQSERTPHILQILTSGSTALGHKSQQCLATFQCSIPLRVDSTSVATHVPGLSPPGDQVLNKEEISRRWQTVQNLKYVRSHCYITGRFAAL